MASTLLLDQVGWDLCLDVAGNIALATEPYATAQDAAASVRTFQGEVYYDVGRGIPYFDQILGHLPPLSLVKAYVEAAAALTPNVVAARAFITGFKGRKLTGQVQITDTAGRLTAAGF
ncbi:hypothetical protein Q8W71_13840 [Methylobacterium sp. NEAU 140]|uniref:hypothetical protein n=1 Tax=Methylobacterium sp. NEAU 140 TaxID=3064945 RepID=UPI0027349B16|nr:hypothetical protein [Methylobacterium sp. NEAU 140]MDP4023713.1 hypothetical protein [Methylobacterium sp. NEAU 140]